MPRNDEPVVSVVIPTYNRAGLLRRGWELIPSGFEPDEFRPSEQARAAIRNKLGLDLYTPLVGYVGRLSPMKDYGNFLIQQQETPISNESRVLW